MSIASKIICNKNVMEKIRINMITHDVCHLKLDDIKLLHYYKLGHNWGDAMNTASENGHLEIVKWLHENRTEGCTVYAMNTAMNGHLEIVKFLHFNRTEGCTTYAMNRAAKHGHLEVVKWLHENRSEGCTTYAMNKAANYGHLDVVKWLHENRTDGGVLMVI